MYKRVPSNRKIAVSMDAASFRTAVPGLHYQPISDTFDDPSVLRTVKLDDDPKSDKSDKIRDDSQAPHITSLPSLTGYRFMVVIIFEAMLLLITLMINVWGTASQPSANGHTLLQSVGQSLKALQGLVVFMAFGCQPDQPAVRIIARGLQRVRRASEMLVFDPNTRMTGYSIDESEEERESTDQQPSPPDPHAADATTSVDAAAPLFYRVSQDRINTARV